MRPLELDEVACVGTGVSEDIAVVVMGWMAMGWMAMDGSFLLSKDSWADVNCNT